MDWTTGPAIEEERCAPTRACSAQDSGGAPGPSTIKGEKLHVLPKI